MQSVGRVMKEKGSGIIINLIEESIEKSNEEAGAYFTSQAGLRELSNQMNLELNPYQVQVVAIESSQNTVEKIFALLEKL